MLEEENNRGASPESVPICSKLKMSLGIKILDVLFTKKFLAKNIAIQRCERRLNASLTNNAIKLTML